MTHTTRTTLTRLILASLMVLSGAMACKSEGTDKGGDKGGDKATADKPGDKAAGGGDSKDKADGKKVGKVTCVYSFYTAWSAMAAAHDFGDFDEREGKMGKLEKEYGVDVVLRRQEYVPSFTTFYTGGADCVTITNTDAQAVAFERKNKVGDATVAVHATSYSDGADKILTDPSITAWDGLKGVPVYGAEFSVTHYLFWRGCQKNNCTYDEYTFKNLEPDKGAPLFAAKQQDIKAFGGWSPETFIVLDKRPDVVDLFNSNKLDKYEIVDMLVFGQKTLDTDAGKAAAKVFAKALDNMKARLEGAERKKALQAISKRFNDLETDKIERALKLTKLFSTAEAKTVLTGPELKANNNYVSEFSLKHDLIKAKINVGWGTSGEKADAVLRFDPSYLP